MFTMFVLTVLFFAYLIRIFEAPYYRGIKNPVFDEYFESIWFTVITLTTVGYGEFSTYTVLGQCITMILTFWGALFISSFVVAVTVLFDMT